MRIALSLVPRSARSKPQAVPQSIKKGRSTAACDVLLMNQHVVATLRTWEVSGRPVVGSGSTAMLF